VRSLLAFVRSIGPGPLYPDQATKVRAHRAPNLIRGCIGRSDRSEQRLISRGEGRIPANGSGTNRCRRRSRARLDRKKPAPKYSDGFLYSNGKGVRHDQRDVVDKRHHRERFMPVSARSTRAALGPFLRFGMHKSLIYGFRASSKAKASSLSSPSSNSSMVYSTGQSGSTPCALAE
jgi:hypothetical protein